MGSPADDAIPLPWRTDYLPELVGFAEAVELLGVEKSTLHAWMKPDTGPNGADADGNGGTHMITPVRVGATPIWVKSDVVRFKAEIGPRRAPRRK